MSDPTNFAPPTGPPTGPPTDLPPETPPEPPAKRGMLRQPLVMMLGALVLVSLTAVGGYAAMRPAKSPLLTAPLGTLEPFVDEQTADTLSLEIFWGDIDEMDYSELTAAVGKIEQGEIDLKALLVHLDFSAGLQSRIGNTRALDGTQDATSKTATAHWTYHPDDGLSIVFERTD